MLNVWTTVQQMEQMSGWEGLEFPRMAHLLGLETKGEIYIQHKSRNITNLHLECLGTMNHLLCMKTNPIAWHAITDSNRFQGDQVEVLE